MRAGTRSSRLIPAQTRMSAEAYDRPRHLPRLLALWPSEIADQSAEGGARIVARLKRALRAERARGRAGHWSYDLNRHVALLGALRAELGRMSHRASADPASGAGPSPHGLP
jgi:hypothetical protein